MTAYMEVWNHGQKRNHLSPRDKARKVATSIIGNNLLLMLTLATSMGIHGSHMYIHFEVYISLVQV